MRLSHRTRSDAAIVVVVLSVVTMVFLNFAEFIGHGLLEPLL
jgi:hypothetical protein